MLSVSGALLLVAAVSVAPLAAATLRSADTSGQEATGALSSRDAKLFPVLKVVTFSNNVCTTDLAEHGACYSKNECQAMGGVASGSCAKGFGVCCVVRQTCGGVIQYNNTYFSNPGYRSTYSVAGMCMAELRPPKGTCQVLLTFVAFDILPPVDGDCGNDTFAFVEGCTTTPLLCGQNTGQHMYIDVDPKNPQPLDKLIFNLGSVAYGRRWNIKVTFLTEKDLYKAPPKVLQWHTALSGSITSFNFGSGNSQYLNDQYHAVCFCNHPGYCETVFTFNTFDVGTAVGGTCPNDFVAVNHEKYCGELDTPFTATYNNTGPNCIWVYSDGENEDQDQGFELTYMHTPCP